MEAMQTMIKCVGIIGVFITSLFVVGLVYYFCLNIFSFDNIAGLNDFMSHFGKSMLPGFLLK